MVEPLQGIHRRTVLLHLLGLAGGCLSGSALAQPTPRSSLVRPRRSSFAGVARSRPFLPLLGPIPLPDDGLSAEQQQQTYRRVALRDELVVPEGFRYDVLMQWGDRLAGDRFGFNNDFLAYCPLAEDRGLLTVNFEYISPRPWIAGYASVIGHPLPFEALQRDLSSLGGSVDALTLSADDPLRAKVLAVASAALEDLGIGVVELRHSGAGGWRHHPGRFDRRISGLCGLRSPDQRLRSTGPASAVFRLRHRLGYDDGLGDRIIGTFANCAGGTTPWGTVLSAEENIQSHVVEAVYADGSSAAPAERPFRFDGDRLEGLGNPFGLAGNKYGWMVEIDPRRPELPAVKHTALGRFRHEAVAVRARAGEPLVVYSGCDRHGGHLYRFVSAELIHDPLDPGNGRLLERGRLEAARFQRDGEGDWLPLLPETPVDPLSPEHFARFGGAALLAVPHSDRGKPGAMLLRGDADGQAYRQRFRTLSDLYPGAGLEQLGAILIDAHLAANAIGATPAARPEDTDLDPRSGDLLITFTAAGADAEGQADPAIFQGPAGQAAWPYGWLMRLQDEPAQAALPGGRFRWRMVATGGTPWEGGMGFANPDNLAVDRAGNVWMVTDRAAVNGSADVFGNNACWLFPASGPQMGAALLFATGPMECELTGPCLDPSETTLFLSVQHPGEDNGPRQGDQQEVQAYRLWDRNGQPFEQLRQVPLGSNWPDGQPGRLPRPGVVAIRRHDGSPLLAGTPG